MEAVISRSKVSVQEFREMLFDNDDDYYYEIIDGEMIQKSAPTPMHQRICRKLSVMLDKYVNDKQAGEIFQAPIDVYLDDYNKPQPDIIFISNEKKAIITNDGIMGVPDLIVEIISPTSVIRDRIDKKRVYERMGVQEFWLVDPQYAAIEIYSLQDSKYDLQSAATAIEGELKSALLQALTINLADLFATAS